MSLLSERKMLVILPNPDDQEPILKKVSSHISGFTYFYAQDGTEAMFKVENDPPDIIMVDPNLPKISIHKLIHWLFEEKQFKNLAVIILSEIPDDTVFVDEVVLGKVHFLPKDSDTLLYSQVLSRSLNYISRSTNTEFHLKFLAPGDLLIKEGENDKNVYILKTGQLSAFHQKGDDKVFLGHINPGEFVGEMAYINGEARSADVKADTDAELIEIPANRLDHLLFEKPAWSKTLMQTLSKRLKRAIG